MNNLLPNTEQWISLTKAAALLGIHSATLRRWADNGQIPFMLTPGGHRRFALSDLNQFAAERRQSGINDNIEQLWVEQALTQTRQAITANKNETWIANYDDEVREQHRILGRRLMGLTLQYISDVDANGTLLKEAEGNWQTVRPFISTVQFTADPGAANHLALSRHVGRHRLPITQLRLD